MVRLNTYLDYSKPIPILVKKPIKYIYIISPYRIGDQAVNVRRSIMVANELMSRGFIPYVPLLDHFWQIISPKRDEDWMRLCKAWIDKCDAAYRIEGESVGGDEEEEYVLSQGKHVYYSIDRIGHESTL